jgi:hypothetical protein
MINGFPLSFFLPLVVHILAGLTAGITGVVMFSLPKRRGSHQRWETSYVWAYSVVFLAVLGYGLALNGYAARRFGQEARVGDTLAKQWVVVHIVGMIGSYVVLWTAFFVDNAHKIPGLNQLPPLTFWVLPSLIGLSFLVVSLSRLAPRMGAASEPGKEEGVIPW